MLSPMIARISSDVALIGVVAGIPSLVAAVVVLWSMPRRRPALVGLVTLVAVVLITLMLLVVFRQSP
jgi:hypothetical protein